MTGFSGTQWLHLLIVNILLIPMTVQALLLSLSDRRLTPLAFKGVPFYSASAVALTAAAWWAYAPHSFPAGPLTQEHLVLSTLAAFLSAVAGGFLTQAQTLRGILREKGLRSVILTGILLLCCAVLLELTLFNYRHYESMFNQEIEVDNIAIGEGLADAHDGGFRILSKGEKSVEVLVIPPELKNLRLDFISEKSSQVNVQIHLTDEGNGAFYKLPGRTVLHEVPQSQYLRIHPYGKVKGIKILLDQPADDIIFLEKLTLNPMTPMTISHPRILVVFGLLLLFTLCRPSSFLYEDPLDLRKPLQRNVLIVTLGLQLLFFWGVIHLNPAMLDPKWSHHHQYQRLSEAFAEGQLHLMEEPSPELLALENPYDPSQRREAHVHFLFDHALYEGKYYVYFGVGPALLLYYPYFLLTGEHLPTWVAIYIAASASALAIAFLLAMMVRKWFKGTPFLVYLISTAFFINGCGLLYIVKRPDFYHMTIVTGLGFSVAGLALWLSTLENASHRALRLLLGSFCMAFVAACRPQLLLGSFLSIVLFWDDVFRERTLFSRRSLRETAAFLAPFVVVAALLMSYNHARFGSPFDFGANYNLTTNDMTLRGMVLDRLPTGFFAYLFQPAAFQTTFPFFKVAGLSTSYQGVTIIENPVGGSLWNQWFLILGFFAFTLRNHFRSAVPRRMSILSVAFALVIIMADTQMAGILMRYVSDYTWLLFIAAILTGFALIDTAASEESQRMYRGGLLVTFVLSMNYQLFTLFIDISSAVMRENPVFSMTVAHLVQFWL